MSYHSKYTREEAKIAREIGLLRQKINMARTKETRDKHTKTRDELLLKLNGKYGTGCQKLYDRYRHVNRVKVRK